MPRPSLWLTIAIWAASVVGLSINMTSSDPLPAGGTFSVVWAQDSATVNPSQFSLYVVPEGPEENIVDAQLVNAGSQLSGTVSMVVPPETSPGVYQALAYIGTASPTTSTSPALWGSEFQIVAAVSSGGSSSSPSGSSSSSPQQGTSNGPQSTPTPSNPSSSSSSPTSNSGPGTPSGSQSATTSPQPSSFSRSPTNSHALSVGAIVGTVLALIFALAGIGLLLLCLRRRRQRARRYSAPETNHPLPESLPVPVITPFTPSAPSTTQVIPSIKEKGVPIGSSTSVSSPSDSSPSGSRALSTTTSELEQREAQHQEALARLEREVQMLRQQQNSHYGDEPPPEYNTL